MKFIIEKILVGIMSCLGTILIVQSHESPNPLSGQNSQPVHHHSASRQPPHPHHQTQGHQGGHALPTLDKSMIQDQEHIMEHLDGKIVRPEETMSEEELQFHYFKVHDYDDNNMLDGIELITALTHHHEGRPKEEGDQQTEPEETVRMSDVELSSTIDAILATNDHNLDGFIDYSEFVRNQRMAATNSEI